MSNEQLLEAATQSEDTVRKIWLHKPDGEGGVGRHTHTRMFDHTEASIYKRASKREEHTNIHNTTNADIHRLKA